MIDYKQLWELARKYRLGKNKRQELPGVRFVSESEIRELNKKYRKKDKSTNVLTFNYSEEDSDIAVCLEVVKREAEELDTQEDDYLAWVMTHAFLHVLGMDHELGPSEAEATQKLEKKILEEAGFVSYNPWPE